MPSLNTLTERSAWPLDAGWYGDTLVFNPVLSHEFLKFSAREVTPIVTDNSSRETMSGEYLPQLLYCRCGRGGLHCVHFEPLGVGVQTTRNM